MSVPTSQYRVQKWKNVSQIIHSGTLYYGIYTIYHIIYTAVHYSPHVLHSSTLCATCLNPTTLRSAHFLGGVVLQEARGEGSTISVKLWPEKRIRLGIARLGSRGELHFTNPDSLNIECVHMAFSACLNYVHKTCISVKLQKNAGKGGAGSSISQIKKV